MKEDLEKLLEFLKSLKEQFEKGYDILNKIESGYDTEELKRYGLNEQEIMQINKHIWFMLCLLNDVEITIENTMKILNKIKGGLKNETNS
jgi:hypothetical protein